MTKHKKSGSGNTGAYVLAGVGALLLLSATAAKSQTDADDSKKQIQTEPGTDAAMKLKVQEFVQKLGTDGQVTTEQIRTYFKGQPIPPEFEKMLDQYSDPKTIFTVDSIYGNITAHGDKGNSTGTATTASGDKGNAKANAWAPPPDSRGSG